MDPSRSLLEAFLLRSTPSSSLYNLNDGVQGPSTAGYPPSHSLDMNSTARHLYTSPSTNVPLTINTSSIPNTTPSANHQYILDMSLCTSASTAAAAAAAAAATAARSMVMAARNVQQQFPSEPIQVEVPRRPPVSNNVAYNQLKDTVVRVQQRKRQRELDQQAAAAATFQATVDYSGQPAMIQTPTATSSTTTNSYITAETSQRGAKIRRREDDRAQESISEGAPSTSTQSLIDSTNRFNNNQQVMGPVRQHEQRNCHFCTTTVPTIAPPLLNRRDVIGSMGQVIAPTAPAQTLPIPNPQPQQTIQNMPNPPQPEQLGLIRPNPMLGALSMLVPMQNQVRVLQEAILQSHVQSLQLRPMPPPGFIYVPSPLSHGLNELVMMSLLHTDNLIRERTALDRHYMFAGLGEDIPIGATSNDIDKNTKLVLFEKEKEVANEEVVEPDRCTVCLSDFESAEEVRLLRCSHIFHPYCIDRWLMYNKKCPVCRMDVDEQAAAEAINAEIPLEPTFPRMI